MTDNPAAPQGPAARLAQYRAARTAGDPAAILAAAGHAFRAVEADHEQRALAAIRAAYAALGDDPDPDAIEKAEADAWHALRQDPDARRAVLETSRERPQPPQPLTAWRDTDEPEAVIWRQADDPRDCWPFVSIGEPAILSGAGGTGKSYAVLELALSAARAAPRNDDTGDDAKYPPGALGFCVRPGPVLLVAYEDSPARLAGRMGRVAGARANIPDALHVMPDPGPLFAAGGERRPGEVLPTPAWTALWQAVADIEPSLIVLDPAAELIDGADANQPGPIRALMRALAAASERHNAGVLIVAHDNKSNRNAVRQGGRPGEGAVAGSTAWTDRARAVAYMGSDPKHRGGRLVECIKVNHGRDGWGMRLKAKRLPHEGFAGWQLARAFEPEEVPWGDKTDIDPTPGANGPPPFRNTATGEIEEWMNDGIA